MIQVRSTKRCEGVSDIYINIKDVLVKKRSTIKLEPREEKKVWKAHEKCHRAFGEVGSCEYSGGAVVPESAPGIPADTAPPAGTGPASTSSVI